MSWLEILGEHNVETVIERLQGCEEPRVIDLAGRGLEPKHVEKLQQVLAHAGCPPCALILRGAILPRLSPILLGAKAHLPLTKLDLHGMSIEQGGGLRWMGPLHIELIAELVKAPGSQLSVLDLGEQALSGTKEVRGRPVMPSATLRQLLWAVRSSSVMTSLRLDGSKLQNTDLAVISEVLFAVDLHSDEPSKLVHLNLAGNTAFTADGVACFLAATKWYPLRIESLNLGQVELNDACHSEALALLERSCTLCELLPYSLKDSNSHGDDSLLAAVLKQLDANKGRRRAQLAAICLSSPVPLPGELYPLIGKNIIDLERSGIRKPTNDRGQRVASTVGEDSATPTAWVDIRRHLEEQRAQLRLLKEQFKKET